jgi:hypothetical protein
MRVKVKRTGVIWEVSEGSPTAKRIKEQPDDYEEVKENKEEPPWVKEEPRIIKEEPPKKKKVLEG